MIPDMLPIFEPVTRQFLGYKERSLVHTHGDWHIGVQANVLRSNSEGTFDILIQRRSAEVDLSKDKYDQSLATQMIQEDDLCEEAALHRGLATELGIQNYKSRGRLDLDFRIVKTYDDDPDKLNREFLRLYIVVIEPETPVGVECPKISSLQWMEWRKFIEFFSERSQSFTKTSQYYFSDPLIFSLIERMSFELTQEGAPYAKQIA